MVKSRQASEPEISSQETHFEERSGDDDVLWAVTEIIAEKGNKYRVLWEGINPETNEPWEPTWVVKRDCTDPLVIAWKKKKAEKRKKKNPGRRSTVKNRASNVSTVSKKSSINSTATITRTSISGKPTTGSKRKQSERESLVSRRSKSPEIDTVSSVRPTKRRKLNVEVVVSPPASKSKGKEKMVLKEEEVQVDLTPASRTAKVNKSAVHVKKEEEESGDEVEVEGESIEIVVKPKNAKLDKKPSRNLESTSSKHKTANGNGYISSVSPPKIKRGRPKAIKVARPRTPSLSSSSESIITTNPILLPKSPPTTTPHNSKSLSPKASSSKHGNSMDNEGDGGLEYADSAVYECQPASFPAASPKSTSPLFLPETRHHSQLTENSRMSSRKVNESHPLIRTPSPSKNSIKSRMKPRTPGSKHILLDPNIIDLTLSPPRSGIDDDTDIKSHTFKKPLRPIPQISPSKFKDHLQSSLEQPSSTIESAERVDDGNDSSIEQFESPVKEKSIVLVSQTDPESTCSMPLPMGTPPAAMAIRGMQMAEANRRQRQAENGKQRRTTKMSLDTILWKDKGKGKARVNISSPSADGGGKAESHSNLEEFADSFVDYEGGGLNEFTQTEDTNELIVNVQAAPKVHLPQEEEENTQDLLAELAPRQSSVPVKDESWAHPSTNVVVDSQDSLIEGISMEVIAPKSSLPMESQFEDSQPMIESEVQQPSPSRSKASHRSASVEIPATLSPIRHVPAESSLPTQSSQDTIHHLESAMNLLNKKSDEINRLENLLAAAQTTIQQLQVDNATLQVQAGSTTAYTSFHNETNHDNDNEEKETLLAAIETAKKKQESTEKDVEFFREQWANASAFVSEVRDENEVLLQRAEIAESQVTVGLEGMKNMFEKRIEQLEKEVRYHKRVTEFVMEQSQKTGEDEIRRKAAEYPELERKYKGLEDMLEGARGMIDVFEKQVSERDRDLGVKRRENAGVKEELDKANKDVERLERELDSMRRELSQRDGDDNNPRNKINGEVEVYRCQWRKDGKDQCDAMFLSREDLERHITSGTHLQ